MIIKKMEGIYIYMQNSPFHEEYKNNTVITVPTALKYKLKIQNLLQ